MKIKIFAIKGKSLVTSGKRRSITHIRYKLLYCFRIEMPEMCRSKFRFYILIYTTKLWARSSAEAHVYDCKRDGSGFDPHSGKWIIIYYYFHSFVMVISYLQAQRLIRLTRKVWFLLKVIISWLLVINRRSVFGNVILYLFMFHIPTLIS